MNATDFSSGCLYLLGVSYQKLFGDTGFVRFALVEVHRIGGSSTFWKMTVGGLLTLGSLTVGNSGLNARLEKCDDRPLCGLSIAVGGVADGLTAMRAGQCQSAREYIVVWAVVV